MRKVKKNNEISKEVISDTDSLLSGYEDIRSYIIGDICGFSHPLGLDLFLKKGFLKWMQVQQESGIWTRLVKEPNIKKEPGFLPGDREQEITMILANMILEERGSHVSHQWNKTEVNTS